jgi:hypothetical protein
MNPQVEDEAARPQGIARSAQNVSVAHTVVDPVNGPEDGLVEEAMIPVIKVVHHYETEQEVSPERELHHALEGRSKLYQEVVGEPGLEQGNEGSLDCQSGEIQDPV